MSSVAQPTLSKQSENVFTKNRFVLSEDPLGETPYERPSDHHRPSPQLGRAEYRCLRYLRSADGVRDLRRLAKWRRFQEERSA